MRLRDRITGCGECMGPGIWDLEGGGARDRQAKGGLGMPGRVLCVDRREGGRRERGEREGRRGGGKGGENGEAEQGWWRALTFIWNPGESSARIWMQAPSTGTKKKSAISGSATRCGLFSIASITADCTGTARGEPHGGGMQRLSEPYDLWPRRKAYFPNPQPLILKP